MPSGRKNLFSRGLALSAAVLLVQFAATDSALATCGDYLMIAGESHEAPASASTEGPASPRPCRGPHCQQAPEAPLPLAPDRTSLTDHDRWGAAFADNARPQPSSSRIDPHGTLLVPAGVSARIERPPRV